jgi:hypothetical protein
MLVEEVSMPFDSFRVPASEHIGARRIAVCVLISGAIAGGTLMLAGVAQSTQSQPDPSRPLLRPEANRLPDANDQMKMRERDVQRLNFDAANAGRRNQLLKASEMLETMAMSLKAEVDQPNDLSPNTIHKAETIEKLARIVKERMMLTVTPK